MSNFNTVIAQMNRGTTHEILSDRLREITQAVRQTGKTGELTLKLKIAPNGDALMITDDIKTKIPELTRGNSIFFADEAGALLARDPRQKSLFAEVEKEAEKVDPETGEILEKDKATA